MTNGIPLNTEPMNVGMTFETKRHALELLGPGENVIISWIVGSHRQLPIPTKVVNTVHPASLFCWKS